MIFAQNVWNKMGIKCCVPLPDTIPQKLNVLYHNACETKVKEHLNPGASFEPLLNVCFVFTT